MKHVLYASQAALLALAALLPASCGRVRTAALRLPPGTPVVLISIDTLRSDHLPIYGYRGVQTPAIDALRGDSLLFVRAYSHVPLTLPSHLTILTGRLPGDLGVRDNTGYRMGNEAAPLLPVELKRRGYATGAVVSAFVLKATSGIARGFDFYDDDIAFQPDIALGGIGRSGSESLALASHWLQGVAGRPFFLFFHIYEPHAPYRSPEPFASRYRAQPYDGGIAAADQVVGGLLAELQRLGVYRRALVVLLSDHGEGLGDHGEEEHGLLLYREALQVPLLVKLPDSGHAGATVGAPAELIDVYPTVAKLLDLPVPADLQGRSLLDLALTASPPAERLIYAETYHARLHYGASELLSLIGERHQYIRSPAPELYDLLADPAERQDLAGAERRTAAALRADLAPLERPLTSPSAVDTETRRRLAALGYLSGAPAAAAAPRGALPDPKSQLPVLRQLREAFNFYNRRDFAAAVPAFRRVLAENPRILDAWEYLARALHATGRLAEALGAAQQAVELSAGDPDDVLAVALLELRLGRPEQAIAAARAAVRSGRASPEALAELARRLTEGGRAGAAIELLRPLSGRHDREATEAKNALFLAYWAAGRPQEARLEAQSVLAIDARNAEAEENLSLVDLRLALWSEARDSARRAVALDPRRGNAWNNLGVALYHLGQPAAALDAWQRAVEVDPQQYDTLYNIGVKAVELGRFDLATRALAQFVATAPAERFAADLPASRELLRRLRARRQQAPSR